MPLTMTEEFAGLLRRAVPMLECLHASNTNELAAEARALLTRFDTERCRHINVELDLADGARASCNDCGASEASRRLAALGGSAPDMEDIPRRRENPDGE